MLPSSVYAVLLFFCSQLIYGAPTVSEVSKRHIPPRSSMPDADSEAPYTNSSCASGAASRKCWTEGFSIETDSEISWPITGATKSVRGTVSTNGEKVLMSSSILSKSQTQQ